MKNLLKLFLFCMIVFSCSEEKEFDGYEKTVVEEKVGTKDYTVMAFEEMRDLTEDGISIVCKGSCNCQAVWVVGSDTVSCSCNDCSMYVHLERATDKIGDYYYSLMNSDFIKYSKIHFDSFITKNYGVSKISVNRMDVNFVEENGILTIDFITPEFEEKTVMIVYNNTNRSTYIVNCVGNCGCRPQFNLETHVASCSCSPCALTVEELER